MTQKGKQDMIRHDLIHILDEHFEQPIDLWPRMRQQLAARSSHRMLPQRWTWKVASVICVLGLAVTVYAVNSLLQQAMKDDQGLMSVEEQGLGQNVVFEQTTNDARLTLEWVYADTARISLGYTLTLLDGEKFENESEGPKPNTHLIDEEGHLFLETHHRVSLEMNRVAYVQSFDTSHLDTLPDRLNLRFIGSFDDTSLTTKRSLGPFNLRFPVTTTAARRLSTPLIVEQSNTKITLQSVVTTPSMTQIEFCYDMTTSPDWQLNYTVSLGGVIQQMEPIYQEYRDDCVAYIYDVSLYESHDPWTISISQMEDYWTAFNETKDLSDRYKAGEAFETILAELEERHLIKRITGPWTFTFTLNS